MTSVPLDVLAESPYVAYSYAYPHKTAYRALTPPVPLDTLWRREQRQSLFLYAHVPFCRMRCGFCNLFTMTNPRDGLAASFVDAVRRQARTATEALADARFVRLAVGGGTPTWLPVDLLETLFDDLERECAVDIGAIPSSIEVSPDTLDTTKLALIEARGFQRVSIGVQTFIEGEARELGRPQAAAVVHRALESLRASSIPVVNIDLIYGGSGQTIETWIESVEAALAYDPQELYLYPLYVRPLTGLDGRAASDRGSGDGFRLHAYRAARDLLLERDYEQVSMRMFRATTAPGDDTAPVYCCQADGMVGLGAGARSYTTSLHYSSEYAVRRRGVRDLVEQYAATPDDRFAVAAHGFRLDGDERRRRYVILSLLQAAGLDRDDYAARFGTEPEQDFPEFAQLERGGAAVNGGARIRLTPLGLEHSDAIGPMFYSPRVDGLSREYAWS